MNTNDWLVENTKWLEKAGVGTARLDCLVLLEDATGKDRAYLLAHPEFPVKGSTFHKLEKQIEKRKKHVPLAQIRGKTEFYGREFIINQDVLEPRPESETMIELLKELIEHEIQDIGYRVIDVGSGSGALAITAKLEFPSLEVLATDIDKKCLDVASKNARKHKANIKFLWGDLLEQTYTPNPKPSILLCNLPYVPDSYEINQAALNEPKIAIFGGRDGLDLYRKMFSQLTKLKDKPTFILTESLPFQHKKLAQIARPAGYKQIGSEDFIQLFELG
ncbi:hypothetical protein A3D14_02545 [Candidatus Saccharibacteria bacterium RIFCSPHIGHO2_02_FULL_47_12]|nr:MAG: hypothetical protein A3D14_02545 [Candidatus Saccharibacteria bacterium RIFCSPHIGHO2_02_FULL_47_12]